MAGIFPACGRSGNPLLEGPGHFGQAGTIMAPWYPACDVFEDKDAVKILGNNTP
jgi:hypothetical protein